ncbi:cytochrome P450 [Phlebopus sp. FC_14]|nr:cytochrome P450 [Phlebopus sp. FC_14]
MYLIASLTFLLVFLVAGKTLTAKRLPLPPGPQGLPLIGSILSVDKQRPWLTYTGWKKSYGDIVSCRVLGQQYIILNSVKVAKALVEQRSNIYSDRPSIALTALSGLDFNTARLPYGGRWRVHRKMYHLVINTEAIQRYHPLLLNTGHVLLESLLHTPEDYFFMSIVFGYDVAPKNDRFVTQIEKLLEAAVYMTPQRVALLSTFPSLLCLPTLFLGAKIQHQTLQCTDLSPEARQTPFKFVKDCLSASIDNRSMVSDFLQRMPLDEPFYEQDIRDCATSAFLAGADSMQSTLLTFILAMILYPDIQDRAHTELNAVVGRRQIPAFADRTSLPYIDAILRETSRWGALVPLAVPHRANKDDIFEGFRIPGGSMVITNLAMTRDEDRFPDPEDFRPERHLNAKGNLLPEDLSDLFFGYGRRICPGRQLADASTWLAIAFMLSHFKFGKAIGPAGYEIDVFPEFSPGIAT